MFRMERKRCQREIKSNTTTPQESRGNALRMGLAYQHITPEHSTEWVGGWAKTCQRVGSRVSSVSRYNNKRSDTNHMTVKATSKLQNIAKICLPHFCQNGARKSHLGMSIAFAMGCECVASAWCMHHISDPLARSAAQSRVARTALICM